VFAFNDKSSDLIDTEYVISHQNGLQKCMVVIQRVMETSFVVFVFQFTIKVFQFQSV